MVTVRLSAVRVFSDRRAACVTLCDKQMLCHSVASPQCSKRKRKKIEKKRKDASVGVWDSHTASPDFILFIA